MNFFQQISAIFNSPAGNAVYHTVLGLSIAGALYGAIKVWRQKKFPQSYRVLIGLSFLLIIRGVLFLGSGSVGLNNVESASIVHVLNIAADILGLIFIFWLWGFPEPNKVADLMVALFSLAAFSLILVHIFISGSFEASFINGFSWGELIWFIMGSFLTLLGAVLLLFRKPNGWEFGLGMATIISLGYLTHFLNPDVPLGYSGQIRLAFLSAYPLLLTLPYRFAQTKISPGKLAKTSQKEQGRRRSTIDLPVLKSILEFSPHASPKELFQSIVRLTSLAIVADICLLIEAPGPQGDVDVLSGYDLIRQDYIPGFTIESKRIPLLSTFIRREQTLHLPASSTSRDLINLSHILQISKSGHLLATPLKIPGTETPKGLVVLSPFSDRQWIKKDQTYLNELVDIITRRMAKAHPSPEVSLERMKSTLQKLKDRYQAAREKNRILQKRINRYEKEIHQKREQDVTDSRGLEAQHRQGEISGTEETKTLALAGFAGSDDQLRAQLKITLEEIAALKEDLEEAENRLKVLREKKTEDTALTITRQKALTQFAREVQEPLQSLLHDSDQLLDQSIDILNSMQRKMLQRIKAHKEEINDIIQKTLKTAEVTPQKKPPPAGRPADLKISLRYALQAIKEQLQGKEISLKVDLPRRLLPVDMPQDVLNDIIVILLANAANETPYKGIVRLVLRMYKEESEQSFAHIQVADQGKGYAKNELPYVIDHSTTPEDTDHFGDQRIKLDLASVRDMVEEHEGRIWVESEPQQGTTISLLLPFVPQKRIESSSTTG